VPGQFDAQGRPKPVDLAALDSHSGGGEADPGISLLPVLFKPVFVFGHAVPAAHVQPASQSLVGTVKSNKRLMVDPLPGPAGTAAVHVLETSRTADRWGALTTPAQRAIYSMFASDQSLGDFLVMVTDVRVTDGPDPVPVTAYRWPRAAVEDYAACGIPKVGIGIPWTHIDPCTDQFFQISQTVMVLPGAKVIGQ